MAGPSPAMTTVRAGRGIHTTRGAASNARGELEHKALGKRAFEVGRFARAPDRVLDERQSLRKPRRAPALAVREKHGLALEMGAGPERLHSILEAAAAGLR